MEIFDVRKATTIFFYTSVSFGESLYFATMDDVNEFTSKNPLPRGKHYVIKTHEVKSYER